MKHFRLPVKLLAVLLVMAIALFAAGCQATPSDPVTPASTDEPPVSAEPPADEKTETEVDYDALASYIPSAAKAVLFLRGTWYEMGRQYAEALPAHVERDVVRNLAGTVAIHGSIEDAWTESQKAVSDNESYMPEALAFLRGIADESGHSYEEIVLAYAVAWGAPYCNSASAWGEATGGDAILGSNSDVNGCVCDDPALIFFPSDPDYPDSCHAIMTSNAFLSNAAMNDVGLCLAMTGGQTAQEGDVDPEGGISAHFSHTFIAARCGTYEELKEDVIAAPYPNGVNHMLIDSEGNGCVVEQTASACAVREHNQSIEGDVDYMIENNCYFSEEMYDHDYHDGNYDDCPFRFSTVQYFMDRDYGNITLDTIREAMAATTYVDPETGVMSDCIAWANDIRSYSSPENVAPICKTAARMLMNASTGSVYILNGPEDPLISLLPGATGTYYRIDLLEDEAMITDSVKLYAALYIYQATKELHESEAVDPVRLANLDKAKELLLLGTNYMDFVGYQNDEATVRSLYSKATTAFVQAQAYAKAAWNNPFTLISDFEEDFYAF